MKKDMIESYPDCRVFFCGKKDDIYRYIVVSPKELETIEDPVPFYFKNRDEDSHDAILYLSQAEWESEKYTLPTDWKEPKEIHHGF